MAKTKQKIADCLLRENEPLPYEVFNEQKKSNVLIVCDHASRVIPKSLGTLGLKSADRKKHIVWDIGTDDLGRKLSNSLKAPAVIATYSRIVIDLNRDCDDKECIRSISDHIPVPGNEKLSAKQKKQRFQEIYWPYHGQIDVQIDKVIRRGEVPFLISVHSFTPTIDDIKRPWHISILWHKEQKIAKRVIQNLRDQNPKLVIGENKPYCLKKHKMGRFTVETHAEERRMPYVLVEFRQDMVDTPRKAARMANIFLKAIKPVLADETIARRRIKKTS